MEGPNGKGVEYSAWIERYGDLAGPVFLRVTLGDDAFDEDETPLFVVDELLESVSWEIGGQVIETYTGAALKILATYDKRARPSVLGREVVICARAPATRRPRTSHCSPSSTRRSRSASDCAASRPSCP